MRYTTYHCGKAVIKDKSLRGECGRKFDWSEIDGKMEN